MTVSMQPVKKSDAGKCWMRKRRDLKRMIAPEYHLIVSEGTRTEPLYFDRVKELINQKYSGRIHLEIVGKGDNTLKLFHQAKIHVEQSNITYKHIWLIYDKDDFPPLSFDQTAELCEQATNEECCYHAIWSNPCFELWFLLHFMYLQTDINRSEYEPKLTECMKERSLGIYAKTRTDMFDTLRPYLDEAVQHSKRLEQTHKETPPSGAAPCTKVHILVEKLRPYI